VKGAGALCFQLVRQFNQLRAGICPKRIHTLDLFVRLWADDVPQISKRNIVHVENTLWASTY